MKICTKCKAEKETSEFYRRRRSCDGRTSHCKNCITEYQQSDTTRQRLKTWYESKNNEIRQRRGFKRKNQPCAGRNRLEKRRDCSLRLKYGISITIYQTLLEKQGGVCAICGNPPKRILVVDHDHNTNQVRGLLCGKCNSGLGLLGDNAEGLLKAFQYLENLEISSRKEAAA